MQQQPYSRFVLPAILALFFQMLLTPAAASAGSFVVRGADVRVDCGHIAQQCEAWRTSLFNKWHRSSAAPWQPRCEVVIHASRASYAKQVGEGSAQTAGSSLIKFAGGNVVHRRIDLLADAAGGLTALPHELTHVVLADVFGGRQPPPWADEGIATLADAHTKRSLHQRDCREAIAAGTAFRVAELFALDRLSRPDQVAAFYGQSLSLTRFLLEQKRPHELIGFLTHSLEVGYDRALKKHYGFETMTDLERAWRHFERTSDHSVDEGHTGSDTPHGTPFARLITSSDKDQPLE